MADETEYGAKWCLGLLCAVLVRFHLEQWWGRAGAKLKALSAENPELKN